MKRTRSTSAGLSTHRHGDTQGRRSGWARVGRLSGVLLGSRPLGCSDLVRGGAHGHLGGLISLREQQEDPGQSGRQVAHRHKSFSSFHWAETHVLQAAQRGLGREGDDEGSEADEAQRELHGRH